MKSKEIAKLVAELSESPPGSAEFLCAYKPACTQIKNNLSRAEKEKYEAMAKEWTNNRLPPRMQERYVYDDNSRRLGANFFALVCGTRMECRP